MTRTLLAAALLLATSLPPALEGVGLEQRLDAQLPLDLELRDESGASVRLGDLIGDRPVILNLGYYECPMLCGLVLNGLVSSLRALPFDVGREFGVVTVSIDPRETAALAAAKKQTVLEAYGRAGAERGWRFLTGDEPSVRRLADAVGFRYSYDAATDSFAHAAGIMVVTPGGKLSRYLYGVSYTPRDVRLALVEASQNRIGSLADQMLLFCYRYDPHSGKYGATLLNLVRTGGVATVLGLTAYVLLALWRERWRARASAG